MTGDAAPAVETTSDSGCAGSEELEQSWGLVLMLARTLLPLLLLLLLPLLTGTSCSCCDSCCSCCWCNCAVSVVAGAGDTAAAGAPLLLLLLPSSTGDGRCTWAGAVGLTS